jgi:hypothetical protein
LQFDLRGSGRLNLADELGADADFTFNNSGFTARVRVTTPLIDVALDGSLTSTGQLCVRGTANVSSLRANATISFCNSGPNEGLRARIVLGELTLTGVITAEGFDLRGTIPRRQGQREVVVYGLDGRPSFVVGGSFEYSLDARITNDTLFIAGTGSVEAYTRWFTSTDRFTLLGAAVRIDSRTGEACVEVGAFGQRVPLCLPGVREAA